MASEESGSESDAEYSGIEQPPIISQLKKILDEYRNDVQIIKELVQNADDAGATELKVLYQGEAINQMVSKKHKYRKFLKAPSLVFYNDAEFTEEDWIGIRSIYTSVKADNPLTVGRFGLGFKSVFHLTDWPCVVSGDRMLFIDPHEKNPGKTCVIVKLMKLERWRKLAVDDCLSALDNTFGFSRDSLKTGHFKGTLFWFPLRTKDTRLSDNICDEVQIETLLKAFISESNRSLLFLKTLCSVQMFVQVPPNADCHNHWLSSVSRGKAEPFHSVKIDNESKSLVEKRKCFINDVTEVGPSKIPNQDMKWTFNVKIETRSLLNGQWSVSTSRWFIFNYLKGRQLSESLKMLLGKEDLCNHHLVGVAAPLSETCDYKHDTGHVFCYQPLPQETKTVTGLPIHVNAFFNLLSNRRHVKWPDEGDTGAALDKSTKWNMLLVDEVLPEAYVCLIQELVNLARQSSNIAYIVQAVYNAIPDTRSVTARWVHLCNTTISRLVDQQILHTERNDWCEPCNALFACQWKNTAVSKECWDSVLDIIKRNEPNLVMVNERVVFSLETQFSSQMNMLTPMRLRSHLLAYDEYKASSPNVKYKILLFLTSTAHFELLADLELLPLADGTFTTYKNNSREIVYVEDEHILQLFIDNRKSFAGTDCCKEVKQLLDLLKGQFQLDELKEDFVIRYMKNKDPVVVPDGIEWLKEVWGVIINRFGGQSLRRFQELRIFPLRNVGKGNYLQIEDLACLQDNLLLFPDVTGQRRQVGDSLIALGLKVVEYLQPWLDIVDIRSFLFTEIPQSFNSLLTRLSQTDVRHFNQNATAEQRKALLNYLSERSVALQFNSTCLHSLVIFPATRSWIDRVSTSALKCIADCSYVYIGKYFPVHFPFLVVSDVTDTEVTLAKTLGAKPIDECQMIIEIFSRNSLGSLSETQKLMTWVLEHGDMLVHNTVLQYLRNVSFLETENGNVHRACDLFDPTQPLLLELFEGENMFPVRSFTSDTFHTSLKRLGLRQTCDLTYTDVEGIIDIIHNNWTTKRQFSTRKVNALMKLVSENKNLIRQQYVENKSWILTNTSKSYPHSIPLKNREMIGPCSPREITSDESIYLIGSLTRVQNCEHLNNLSELFRWRRRPDVHSVIEHLKNIITSYRLENKAECLQMITDVFIFMSDEFMASQFSEIWKRTFSVNSPCVWNGESFIPACRVYLQRDTDYIDLSPYYYPIPDELKQAVGALEKIGCITKMGLHEYLDVLDLVRCNSEDEMSHDRTHHDLRLTIAILQKLQLDYLEEVKEPELHNRLLLPVDTEEGLLLKQVKQCVILSNADSISIDVDNDDEHSEIFPIHRDVPVTTAVNLGVRSIQQHMLSDAEAFEEWGQNEPLTRRIRLLLKEGYVDGFSIAKELLQNAEDAGATKLYFLYDERENYEVRKFLINDELSELQGPALWVFNDAMFSESDFQNITKLSGETKIEDSTKIGKFGLGFNAVYNLTDVPSFISGDSFVMFDPHTTYIGKALPGNSPGLRINFRKMKRARANRLRHQFEVFNGILGCEISEGVPHINGTLFRLPLRKHGSQISDTVYTFTEVKRLINKIIEFGADMFIFNQNVKELKFFHLQNKADTSSVKEVYHVQKSIKDVGPNSFPGQTVLQVASNKKKNNEFKVSPLQLIQDIRIEMVQMSDSYLGLNSLKTSCSWKVAWATGNKPLTLQLAETEKGGLPLGAVAIPIIKEDGSRSTCLPIGDVPRGFVKNGSFFFFLPLPVTHSFEFHINSQFSTTSDRRQLRSSNTDDKASNVGLWNECLMNDAVVNALLNYFQNHDMLLEDPFSLWPVAENTLLEQQLTRSFYDHITSYPSSYKIFYVNGKYYTLSESVFIGRCILENEEITPIIFDMLSSLVPGKVVIRLPRHILQHMERSDGELIRKKTVTAKQFLYNYFLPNIDKYGHSADAMAKRDTVLSFAVLFDDEEIKDWMKNHPSIPVEPDGHLRKPGEIVEQTASFAKLFKEEDSRFLRSRFRNDAKVLEGLHALGMMRYNMPDYLVIDRAHSVNEYLKSCTKCSIEQCVAFLHYLHEHRSQSKLQELCDIAFLPVKRRPTEWPCIWGSDYRQYTEDICNQHDGITRVCIESPRRLFRSSCVNLVGCIECILDEEILDSSGRSNFTKSSEDIFNHLGVKIITDDNVSTDIVIKQLLVISERKGIESFKLLDRILQSVNEYLNKICSKKDRKGVLKSICKKEVVWTGNTFLSPEIVAESQKPDCRPFLYSLSDTLLGRHRFRFLCEELEIKKTFTPFDYTKVLKQIHINKGGQPLDVTQVDTCISVLHCLAGSIDVKKLSWGDVANVDDIGEIYIPDVNSVLRENTSLCFDDCEEIDHTENMIYVHPKVSPLVAQAFGVKRKAIQNFEDHSVDIQDFYQSEPLITRLKRLLEGYPCDIGVFKELLQNADDAGATEINFIIDTCEHPTDSLLHESLAPLQGPALCVYNNRGFTEEDLIGIQRLGEGNKNDDPSKTGRYGVGFNAVYHLTDAPSFLTKGPNVKNGETLCMFDPMARFVPGTSKKTPGKRLLNMKKIRSSMTNTLSAHHENLLNDNEGTVFRFPLRRSGDKSEIETRSITVQELKQLIEIFKNDIADMLLFLKNISKVQFTAYENGDYKPTAYVTLTMKEDDRQRRSDFNSKWLNFCQNNKSSRSLTSMVGQETVAYNVCVEVKKTNGFSLTSHFLVVQTFGFKESLPEILNKEIGDGNIGLLPHGGVACKISGDLSSTPKMYCFLPLPTKSNLPVHVHGYFAINHESRRDLWYSNEKDCFRTVWNQTIISQIIVTAYSRLIERQKKNLTEPFEEGTHDTKRLTQAIRSFEKNLPVPTQVITIYTSFLIKSVYNELVKTEFKFLPIIQTRIEKEKSSGYFPFIRGLEQHRSTASLAWTALTVKGHLYPAFHNDEIEIKDGNESLSNVLRKLGMNIAIVGKEIRDAMKYSGVAIEDAKPEHVIRFMSVDNDQLDACQIQEGEMLEASALQSTIAYEKLLEFVSRDLKVFALSLSVIPIILTCSGRLMKGKMPGLFVSTFSDLFPDMEHMFVHKKAHQVFNKLLHHSKDFSVSVVRRFGLHDFVQLANETCKIPMNKSEYVSLESSGLSEQWVKNFWAFFKSQIDYKTDVTKDFESLRHLSLVPLIDPINDNVCLCNSGQLSTVVDTESFSCTMKKLLLKFRLPILNKQMMEVYSGESNSVYLKAKEHIAKAHKPCRLVNCLQFHAERYTYQASAQDCNDILKYFAENLEELDAEALAKLKSLQIYVSKQGKRQSLVDFPKAYTVPRNIPGAGFSAIINVTGTLFLQENDAFSKLYSFLGVRILSWMDVYMEFIFPRQNEMDRSAFYEHLRFIADECNNYKKKQDLSTLLEMLKYIPFVETTSGNLSTVSNMFDSQKEIFKEFCTDSELLPEALSKDYNVMRLLQKLGLKTEMCEVLFERFAKQIENVGAVTVTEGVRSKSKLLIKTLLEMGKSFFQNHSLSRLAQIRFVVPLTVAAQVQTIHKQCQNPPLVCYQNSIVPDAQLVCWTTCIILPEYAIPRQEFDLVQKKLLFQTMPSPIDWISHVKNVGTALENTLNIEPTRLQSCAVELVMSCIYDSMGLYRSNGTLLKSLKETPLIYFKDKKVIVQPQNVVSMCEYKQQIEPYLMQLPTDYLKYNESFIDAGIRTKLTADSFAIVLKEIHDRCTSEQLMPKERSDALKATKQLFLAIGSQMKETEFSVDKLYLPCDDNTLCLSVDVVIDDNNYYKRRLGNADIKFMTKPRYLLRHHILEWLKFFPEQYRPTTLMRLVEEKVDLEEITQVESSDSRALDTYYHSRPFINAFLRLAKDGTKQWNEDKEAKIRSAVARIQMKQVIGLRTYLWIYQLQNGEKVNKMRKEDSVLPQTVHVESQNGEIKVYIQSADPDWFDLLRKCLSRFLVRYFSLDFGSDNFVLYDILKPQSSDELSKILDKEHIPAYTTETDTGDGDYPIPGRIVPKELHKYLDNDYGIIRDYDYKFIAFQVDDPVEMDSDIDEDSTFENTDVNPTYVFVHVIEKVKETENNLSLYQEYKIDVGEEETKTVPSYLLFKFVRKIEEKKLLSPMKALVPQTGIPDSMRQPDFSIQDICNEIRLILIEAFTKESNERKNIVKRLWLKWHPDKNPNNVEKATQIFQYVQMCLEWLENGKTPPTFSGSRDDTDSGSSNSYTSREGQYQERYWRRYRRAYDEHFWTSGSTDDFPGFSGSRTCGSSASFGSSFGFASSRGGHSGHSQPSAEPYHWYEEARRWQEQATFDLEDAQVSLSDGQGHTNNMICYKAHQAAEKSLKGAWYSHDANQIQAVKNSHNLVMIASGLCPELQGQVAELVHITGEHTRMRYPDTWSGTIPARAYSRDQAERVTRLAADIIEIVRRHYMK